MKKTNVTRLLDEQGIEYEVKPHKKQVYLRQRMPHVNEVSESSRSLRR